MTLDELITKRLHVVESLTACRELQQQFQQQLNTELNREQRILGALGIYNDLIKELEEKAKCQNQSSATGPATSPPPTTDTARPNGKGSPGSSVESADSTSQPPSPESTKPKDSSSAANATTNSGTQT